MKSDIFYSKRLAHSLGVCLRAECRETAVLLQRQIAGLLLQDSEHQFSTAVTPISTLWSHQLLGIRTVTVWSSHTHLCSPSEKRKVRSEEGTLFRRHLTGDEEVLCCLHTALFNPIMPLFHSTITCIVHGCRMAQLNSIGEFDKRCHLLSPLTALLKETHTLYNLIAK